MRIAQLNLHFKFAILTAVIINAGFLRCFRDPIRTACGPRERSQLQKMLQ